MLDLCHTELSNPQQPVSRSDFIPEAKPDLCRSEGHSLLIIIQQAPIYKEMLLSRVLVSNDRVSLSIERPEVYKETLCCLGSQITYRSSFWTNRGFKHKVERKRFGEIVLGIGR